VVRAYHAALRRDRDRLSRVSANAGIAEIRVGERSTLIGHPLAEAALPDGTIVISVRRADSVLLGIGSAQLRAGDLVTVLARPSQLAAVRELLEPR
jgi:chloride channel protein, CIC family